MWSSLREDLLSNARRQLRHIRSDLLKEAEGVGVQKICKIGCICMKYAG